VTLQDLLGYCDDNTRNTYSSKSLSVQPS